MEKDVLLEMLAEVCGKKSKTGSFEFSDQEAVTILISGGGPVFPIENVSRLEVKDAHLVARTNRSEVYLLALAQLVGIKLQRSKKEGTGFVP
jgi:hypothetical protein